MSAPDPRRVATLDDVLAAVARRVPYLRASVAPAGDDWVACDALRDPSTLAAVVRGTRAGFATDDDAVAASLFAQAYAFRVGGVALAAFALGLPVPDVDPAATAVRLDKPRPSAVAYLRPDLERLDATGVAGRLLEGHLAGFVAALHGRFRVGERLLWGDVAASCAAAFRAVESSGPDAAAVRARAEALVAAAGPRFEGLGGFSTLRGAGRAGWYWDRTSCCLWFRTAGGRLCDNCSLLDDETRRAQRLGELAERVP